MNDDIVVRQAQPEDAPAMARVHVVSWRETYRGLMRDDALDDPDLLPARERFWTVVLTDERFARNRVAVAERSGALVGIAMSGRSDEDELSAQLFVLYLLAAHHGSGIGARLLCAVIDRAETTSLWVAEPNPRAQAFYRKHGFRPDGRSRIEDGVHEIGMVRCRDHDWPPAAARDRWSRG